MTRAAFLIALAALSAFVRADQGSPDLVLFNGKIFTADPENPSAEAIAILGDRILAVGTKAELVPRAGAETRRIDLRGRVVTPGFNDAHFHFAPVPAGFNLKLETNEPTWAQTSAAISDAVRDAAEGTWIFGTIGYGVVLDERVTRFVLDELAPAHPVLLEAYYGHGAIASSKAMERLGIAEDETDPAGGYYERVPRSRRLNGRMWEYAHWGPSRRFAQQVADDVAVDALRRTATEATELGITSMQIFPAMEIERFGRLLALADLPIRVRAIAINR